MKNGREVTFYAFLPIFYQSQAITTCEVIWILLKFAQKLISEEIIFVESLPNAHRLIHYLINWIT